MKFTYRLVVEQYVDNELDYALEKYPAFNSPHEAYGVLAEEFKEVLDALHANDFVQLYKELAQVSAVARKAMMMIDEKGLNNVTTTQPDPNATYSLGGPCADHAHTEDPAHHVCPYRPLSPTSCHIRNKDCGFEFHRNRLEYSGGRKYFVEECSHDAVTYVEHNRYDTTVL